jgi:hypothetical protein
LNYYTNDYKAAGTVSFDPDVTAVTKSNYYNSAQQLFNGNIRSMTVAVKALGKFGNAMGYSYRYDQLNRISQLNAWNDTLTAGAAPSAWTLKNNFQERITYDPNGNIMSYLRLQNTGLRMDSMTYRYYGGTNRLRHIRDTVATNRYNYDIDTQESLNAGNNYIYDGAGNLVKDTSEALNVTWSPYGKVLEAKRFRTAAPAVNISTQYGYDPMQNRVLKLYINGTDTTKTYYIRDAQGNTMAVYTRRKDTLVWSEQHLYGSSRLGTWEPNQRLTPSVDTTKKWHLLEGQKRYELTNHLGNVLVTINDRRQGVNFNTTTTVYAFYDAVTIQATDYYPFGLEMSGRTYQAPNTSAYRFGFNGQEKSPEISNGNYTALYWEYDSRIAKRWNRDPVDEADVSPYAAFDNSPILYDDPDGDCPKCLKALGKTLVKSIAKGKVDLGEIYDAVDAVKTLVSPTSTLLDKGLAVFDLVSPVSSKEIKAGVKAVEGAIDALDDVNDIAKAVDKVTDVSKATDKVADVSKAAKKTPGAKKTYQTYTKPPLDPKTHGTYSGRTSGKNTPKKNVTKRDQDHHMNDTHGPAVLDKSSKNKKAIRGREQQLIDKNGKAQSDGGTSGNAVRGVSERNKNKGKYEKAANREFGKLK